MSTTSIAQATSDRFQLKSSANIVKNWGCCSVVGLSGASIFKITSLCRCQGRPSVNTESGCFLNGLQRIITFVPVCSPTLEQVFFIKSSAFSIQKYHILKLLKKKATPTWLIVNQFYFKEDPPVSNLVLGQLGPSDCNSSERFTHSDFQKSSSVFSGVSMDHFWNWIVFLLPFWAMWRKGAAD